MAELETGHAKHEQARQQERDAALATLSVRFAEDEDIVKLVREVAWNYMT